MPLTRKPKAVLIDLAGVLHTGDAALPGAVAALARLRDSGLPLRFITNTTRSTRSSVVRNLQQMGFALELEEVHTAVMAALGVVRARGLRPHYLVHPDVEEETGPSDPQPDALVLGDAGRHFTYARLNAAFRLLMQGVPFIAMARNRYFMEEDGLSLDMGAFVTGLEFSAGVQAEVVGKPARAFFEAALADLGVAREEAVLVGDDVHDDVGGAQNAGLAGILVRTGKYRPSDAQDPAVTPAVVCDDFAAAVEAILAA
jgi:HAD superfamily hydrolase (TIGR01458 family)